jgi:hypothetical protein
VSVRCCQVEVSASGRSLVRRSPTECRVCPSVISKPQQCGGLGPCRVVAPQGEKNIATCIGVLNFFFKLQIDFLEAYLVRKILSFHTGIN